MTWPRGERGSVLMLFPAVVLVVLMLGAICVDSASAYLARRALLDELTAIVDDVSARAVDPAAFYATPSVLRLDENKAEAVAADHVAAASRDGGVTVTDWHLALSADGRSVTVTATGTARRVFAPALGHTYRVRGEATARLREVRVRMAPPGP